MKELEIDAKSENIEAVLEFIHAELEAIGYSMKAQNQIALAVEEIFINIAKYAYSPETGSAVIRMAAGDEIVIIFEDNGKPYNPLEKADPDVNAPMEDREIGGLGIFLVKKIMDVVEYEHKGGKNILTIKWNTIKELS